MNDDGRTQNISGSGVLFHGREPMDLEIPVEIVMDVPAEVPGQAAGASLGRGASSGSEPDAVTRGRHSRPRSLIGKRWWIRGGSSA